MKSLHIYDPALCCSSGVCGPAVDPSLVRFAADLKWLEAQGVSVTRHNLSQNPAAFVAHDAVKTALSTTGESALPLLFADDEVIASGSYPTRFELAAAVGLGADDDAEGLSQAVVELIAIGAAIASNCEPCLRYHVREAEKLGVSAADMACAVDVATRVKDAPHQAVLRLASQLIPVTAEDENSGCCGDDGDESATAGNCCGGDAGETKADSGCCGGEASEPANASERCGGGDTNEAKPAGERCCG